MRRSSGTDRIQLCAKRKYCRFAYFVTMDGKCWMRLEFRFKFVSDASSACPPGIKTWPRSSGWLEEEEEEVEDDPLEPPKK